MVGTKVGQQRISLALRLKKLLEQKHYQALLVSLDEFYADYLLGLKVDAFVSTACPRIAVDDYLRYSRPILTPVELEILLGERKWDHYILDEIGVEKME